MVHMAPRRVGSAGMSEGDSHNTADTKDKDQSNNNTFHQGTPASIGLTRDGCRDLKKISRC